MRCCRPTSLPERFQLAYHRSCLYSCALLPQGCHTRFTLPKVTRHDYLNGVSASLSLSSTRGFRPDRRGTCEERSFRSAPRYSPPLSSRGDPHAWVEATKSFLPPASLLNSLGNTSLSSESPHSASDILAFLVSARRSCGVDVLFQLGVRHGQWSAVLWMVRRILQLLNSSPGQQDLGHLKRTANLNQLTRSAIRIDTSLLARHDPLTDAVFSVKTRRLQRSSIGEVWKSLGSMILTAADESGRNSKDIMPYVLQIIAHLHHIDALPQNFYSFSPPAEGTALYRPPLLHLLSSRILTSLSDAVWRAQEKLAEAAAVGARYTFLGYEVPGAWYKIKVRELGPEIWMELVLWACADAGLFEEGASILRQLKSRASPDSRWLTISWEDVQLGSPTQGITQPRVDWAQLKSRFRGAATAKDGYSLSPPSVELGPRTISSEVVKAIINGLSINVGATTTKEDGLLPRHILKTIIDLQELLLRNGYSLHADCVKEMIALMGDPSRPELLSDPELLNSMVTIATTSAINTRAARGTEVKTSESRPSDISHQSAAMYDLLYSLLQIYAEAGDLRRAYNVFGHLQAINRRRESSSFNGLANASQSYDGDLDDNALRPFSPLHISALASFLDLITQAGDFRRGRNILYLPRMSERMIPEDLYSDVCLIPSLLRFAGATSDVRLLEKLEAHIPTPMSGDVRRALLHCLALLRRWDTLEQVLRAPRRDDTASWDAELAFSLANFIVLAQRRSSAAVASGSSTETSLNEEVAFTSQVLHRLLRGDFGTPEADRIRSRREREKYVVCISRLIHDASNGLADVGVISNTRWKALQDTTNIPARAFNLLLATVVFQRGSLIGKRMWDLWCNNEALMVGRKSGGISTATAPKEMLGTSWNLDYSFEPPPGIASRAKGPGWSERLRQSNESLSDNHRSDVLLQPGRPRMGLVVPNLITLLIIMRGARAELDRLRGTEKHGRHMPPRSTHPDPDKTLGRGQQDSRDASHEEKRQLTALLSWGTKKFKAFGYRVDEIREELGGGRKKRGRQSRQNGQFRQFQRDRRPRQLQHNNRLAQLPHHSRLYYRLTSPHRIHRRQKPRTKQTWPSLQNFDRKDMLRATSQLL